MTWIEYSGRVDHLAADHGAAFVDLETRALVAILGLSRLGGRLPHRARRQQGPGQLRRADPRRLRSPWCFPRRAGHSPPLRHRPTRSAAVAERSETRRTGSCFRWSTHSQKPSYRAQGGGSVGGLVWVDTDDDHRGVSPRAGGRGIAVGIPVFGYRQVVTFLCPDSQRADRK